MKKGYLMYLAVGTALCLFGLHKFNQLLDRAQAKVDAAGARLTNLEKAITSDIPLVPEAAIPVIVPVPDIPLEPVSVTEPAKPESKPEPPAPVIGIAPKCYPVEVLGLKPWYDDPKKNGTGKLHPELQFSFARERDPSGSCPKHWDYSGGNFGGIYFTAPHK